MAPKATREYHTSIDSRPSTDPDLMIFIRGNEGPKGSTRVQRLKPTPHPFCWKSRLKLRKVLREET